MFPGQVHYHGVSHTILFVVVAIALIGGVAALVFTHPLDRWLGWDRFDKSFSLDVIYSSDRLFNNVFLLAMFLIHAGITYVVRPIEHRYRLGRSA